MGGSGEAVFSRHHRVIFTCQLTVVVTEYIRSAQDQARGRAPNLSEEVLATDRVGRPAFFRDVAPCSSRYPYTCVHTERTIWIWQVFKRST